MHTSNNSYCNKYNVKLINNNYCPITDNSSICSLDRKFKEMRIKKKANKIFTLEQPFPELQRALERRGWIQKCLPNQVTAATALTNPFLQMYCPNFVWSSTYRSKYEFNKDSPHYSRLIMPNCDRDFTSRCGLVKLFQNSHWFFMQDQSNVIFPVSYVITDKTQQKALIEDFRQTFFFGFLRYIVDRGEELFHENGVFSLNYLSVAVEQVRKAVYLKTNNDVDANIYKDSSPITSFSMAKFKEIFKRIREGDQIKIVPGDNVKDILSDVKLILDKAIAFYPELTRNGYHNIWILKPCARDDNFSIRLSSSEGEIKHLVTQNESTYVVQKYIERPLLIHKTKFSVRQHFLVVMDGKYLSVWMYKTSFLKFCGQEFDLDELCESIHLTNSRNRNRYTNCPIRSDLLPQDNIWSLSKFRDHLKSIGEEEVWEKKIYPEMIESILTILNGSTEELVFVKNNFQLFSADFVVTDEFNPVLVEIKPTPNLEQTGNSSKKFCSALIRDMLKVVLDRLKKPKCRTGDFERVWHWVYLEHKVRTSLTVHGKGILDNQDKLTPCNSDQFKLSKYEKNMENMAIIGWLEERSDGNLSIPHKNLQSSKWKY